MPKQVGTEISGLRAGTNQPEHRDVVAVKVLPRTHNRGGDRRWLQASTHNTIERRKWDIGGDPEEIRPIT
jgi:hypothetical protein